MSDATFKVGDEVQPVELWGVKYRKPTRIVRETTTTWVTECGSKWRKSDGALTPKYIDTRRRIVPVDA